MRVAAPGKLVLTGAYAVLWGARAVVVAVDRHATASVTQPDAIDVRPLHDEGGVKLGLGSSAAARVVAAAARGIARGDDVKRDDVRERIYREAREAHDGEQPGGSGVDVAASTWGGAIVFAMGAPLRHVRRVAWPDELTLAAYFSGTPARTSDLRARVAAAVDRPLGAQVRADLCALAEEAADAFATADVSRFVRAARAYGTALATLGSLADAPIVPPAFAELARLAAAEGAAFLPSGAGGGDCGVWLGPRPSGPGFGARARALGLRALDLKLDPDGVRTLA